MQKGDFTIDKTHGTSGVGVGCSSPLELLRLVAERQSNMETMIVPGRKK